jgi:hypothetical protein
MQNTQNTLPFLYPFRSDCGLVWQLYIARDQTRTVLQYISRDVKCALFCLGKVDGNAGAPAGTPNGAPLRTRRGTSARSSSQASIPVVGLGFVRLSGEVVTGESSAIGMGPLVDRGGSSFEVDGPEVSLSEILSTSSRVPP